MSYKHDFLQWMEVLP